MNTKSVLIAALIAASTGSVFAAEYTAAAGNPSVQVTAPAAPTRAEVRAVTVAAKADGTTDGWKDTAAVPTTAKADARPRAEVRAEVRAYDKSWIASRINRDVTEGAAQ